ncbi:MAG: hypothetical protein ACT4OS_03835 [Acidimicrobiales bacterium]
MPGWSDYVDTGLDEIRHWGSGSLQVQRRMRALLDDLLAAAPGDRRPPLDEQRRLIKDRADENLPDAEQCDPDLNQQAGVACSPPQPSPWSSDPGRLTASARSLSNGVMLRRPTTPGVARLWYHPDTISHGYDSPLDR